MGLSIYYYRDSYYLLVCDACSQYVLSYRDYLDSSSTAPQFMSTTVFSWVSLIGNAKRCLPFPLSRGNNIEFGLWFVMATFIYYTPSINRRCGTYTMIECIYVGFVVSRRSRNSDDIREGMKQPLLFVVVVGGHKVFKCRVLCVNACE